MISIQIPPSFTSIHSEIIPDHDQNDNRNSKPKTDIIKGLFGSAAALQSDIRYNEVDMRQIR